MVLKKWLETTQHIVLHYAFQINTLLAARNLGKTTFPTGQKQKVNKRLKNRQNAIDRMQHNENLTLTRLS
jgi:hypothetical protein